MRIHNNGQSAGEHNSAPRPSRHGWLALAVATAYGALAFHLKDPQAAVVVFNSVLLSLGGGGRRH